MFSMVQPAAYADVFLTEDFTTLYILLTAIFAAVLVTIFSIFMVQKSTVAFVALGAILSVSGLGVVATITHKEDALNESLAKNMTENVREKYDAELKMDFSRTDDLKNLQETRSYELAFENGVTANYKMFFNEDSEPVIVEDDKAPTPSQLNAKAGSSATTKSSEQDKK